MFHLAIPAQDLDASIAFYEKLGAKVEIGRRYRVSAIMNFHGHQVVLHKSDKIDPSPMMYPRHFGIIVDTYEEFSDLYSSMPHPYWQEVVVRHQGEPGEHFTFFICDPSNNLIEFKYYMRQEDVF